jgi:hypothetical protein
VLAAAVEVVAAGLFRQWMNQQLADIWIARHDQAAPGW